MPSCEFCGCKLTNDASNQPPEGECDFFFCDKEECVLLAESYREQKREESKVSQ
jgi:hypothetical protein